MNHAQLQKWKRKISVAGPVVQAEKAFGTGSYTVDRTVNASTGISTVQSSKPYTPEHSISMSSDYLGRTKSRTETGLGTSTYIHDIYSNLLSETDAFGRTQSWIRDAFDRVISYTNFAGQTTTWTYDAWGNVLSQTDPNSLSTSYTYDERSRVLSVTDADGGVITTVYDVKGRKISLTTPNGQTTSWTYDIYDRVLTETNALTQTKTFGYDAADRKTLVIKPDGNKIQYTYGNGSNPTKEEWLVGTNVIETLNFQYDAVGKMTSASDSATSLEFTYTDGLLSREKQTLAPGIIAQSDYIYAGGQVREVSLKLGASATFDSKVSYTYTANGQVATLQQTGPTTDTKSIRYSYDQAGNRVRTERFSDVGYATPIFETLSSYTNAQGQLKPTVQSIKHQRATGTVLASYDFVWDAGNRLSSMTSSADGLTTYSYTPTNQLSAIDYANAPDQSFTYDLNGNRTGSGNVTGADNRLTSNATWDFVYDANGNMTRRTLKSDNSYIEYTYDHRDRLTDVRYRTSAGTLTKRVHFGYDALNRRYLQTVENGSGTILSTVYYVNQGFRKDRGDAGDEIALRLDGAGAVISRYLHGSLVDEVLAEENIGSGGVRDVLWAMTDHQGSVRDLARVTSGTASVVNHIVYDAFGKTVSETDAAIAHLYGYTGRELDKETGLQYNRARYLDLVLARWISQDPIGFAEGDANLYRYVGNSPTNRTDPSGLDWLDEAAGFSAGIGDSMSFGLGWLIRDKLVGINTVDYNGGGYYWGGCGGVAVDVGTCGLTAIPKAGGKAVIKSAAKEGAEAVAREIAERAAREAAEAAAKVAAEAAAKNQAKSGSKGLLDWWKRGSEIDDYWRSLSLMDKIMYEIGEKTLASAKYAEYANLDRVSRGRKIIEDSGWLRAVCPEGTGWRLGAGTTLGTGPTPSVRWLVPHAIVITVRSIFVSNWNSSKPVENPAQ